jgi:hypothetical protein
MKRELILMITLRDVICVTAMKSVEPSRLETLPRVAILNESEINHPDATETPDGVNVMKFCDIDVASSVHKYETILLADNQMQRGQSLRKRVGDGDESSGEPDPKRLVTSDSSTEPKTLVEVSCEFMNNGDTCSS